MNESATVDAMGEHAADFVGVINGTRDIMVPTINSFTLSQHIPNAQLILYPDANHGSQYQYPERFVRHVSKKARERVPVRMNPAIKEIHS